MGCAGHPLIKTPNLDSLAARGTLSNNGYSPNPICVPSRATMITGNYSHKCTGEKRNRGEVLDGQFKLPQFLSENGYKTYSSGKLHYLPYKENKEEQTLHGFQKAKLAESGRMLATFDPKGEKSGVEDYFDYLSEVGYKGFSRAHAIGNNDLHPTKSPLPQEHNVDAWVATEAINFLKEHCENDSDQPFMLHASFPKPHSPYDPPAPFDTMYDPRDVEAPAVNKDGLERTPTSKVEAINHGIEVFSPEALKVMKAHYMWLISFQDKQIGRIIDHLKAINQYENTIIVFSADHGDMQGDFGFVFKASMYEGSCRVPFLISYPKELLQNNVSDALVGLQDIVPTLVDLVGLDMPQKVDGISLKSELTEVGHKQR